MDKEILKKILQIDSLIIILDWYERVTVHHLISGERKATSSERISQLYVWIQENEWECPERKYGHDRVLYFKDSDSGKWFPDYYYVKINNEYRWMLQLKNN